MALQNGISYEPSTGRYVAGIAICQLISPSAAYMRRWTGQSWFR